MPVVEIADAVRVRVPAKVNLHLSVGTARPDGYHDLTTVFQAVSVYDDVIARGADGIHVKTAGPYARGVPTDDANLAWRAAELLAAHTGASADVRLELHKNIPLAGGMAGGSADAAATLVACAALWRTGTPRTQLASLAAELGSDVTFPLTGGRRSESGRGEQLTPVLATGEYHWVFALADLGLSTVDVYRELDRLRADGQAPDPIGAADEMLDALRAGDCGRVADALGNDLQPAALSLRPGTRRRPRDRRRTRRAGRHRVGIRPDVRVPVRTRRRRAGSRGRTRPCRRLRRDPGRHRARSWRANHRLMANLVNLETVGKSYGTTTVLDAVSLGIAAGERIGVVGRNGGGKTTLLRMIIGTETPDTGRVT